MPVLTRVNEEQASSATKTPERCNIMKSPSKTATETAVFVDTVLMITLLFFFWIFRLNQSDQSKTAMLLPEPVPD
jgi:hypothetical protein